MKREIKFRAWDKSKNKWLGMWIFRGGHTGAKNHYDEPEIFDMPKYFEKSTVIMQYTGLKDKNGKEIYEGDLLRIRYNIGEAKEYYTDSIYSVDVLSFKGLSLNFRKLFNEEDKKNQIPISQTLSFAYGNLKTNYVEQKYDQLAVADTEGHNYNSRTSWKENHWSSDFEIVGNIYQNPELLNETSD